MQKRRVLIFVDQFEGLFTQAGHDVARLSEAISEAYETDSSADVPPSDTANVANGQTPGCVNVANASMGGNPIAPPRADFRDWMVATATLEVKFKELKDAARTRNALLMRFTPDQARFVSWAIFWRRSGRG